MLTLDFVHSDLRLLLLVIFDLLTATTNIYNEDVISKDVHIWFTYRLLPGDAS